MYVRGSWLVYIVHVQCTRLLACGSRLYCLTYMALGYIVPLTCLLAILSHLHASWLYCPTYMALGLWLVSILSHLHGSRLVAGVYIVPLTWLLACGWCLYCPTYMALGLWLVSILSHLHGSWLVAGVYIASWSPGRSLLVAGPAVGKEALNNEVVRWHYHSLVPTMAFYHRWEKRWSKDDKCYQELIKPAREHVTM